MKDRNSNGYVRGQEFGELRSDVNNLQKDINSIMTNHLPHIQERLEKQDTKLVWILTSLVVVLLTLVGNLILRTLTS